MSEQKSLTSQVWELGKSRGFSTAQIRSNWKQLYNEVYDLEINTARTGIEEIFSELENTISRFTKSNATERAEKISLENIKNAVKQAINEQGYKEAFKNFSAIYDGGMGEWIQRIISAIYDRELAQWAEGMQKYLERFQAEIVNKMNIKHFERVNIANPFNEEETANTETEKNISQKEIQKLIDLIK